MRRRGQQQQVRRRVREQPGEPVPRDVLAVAGDAMRLVDDHDVPASGGQIGGARDVVALDPLIGPARRVSSGFTASSGMMRRSYAEPEVVLAPACQRTDLGRRQRHELLVEAAKELALPLGAQAPSGRRSGPAEPARGAAAR